ncbi:hypothetical protein KP509_35G064200 [Ceratopteris richardii]|uniref:Uncharacterized protein n=1 Tax=Ceratopteris richardii TaxID=49495 RepID=A0A8T2QIV8_CERRI|nr:hypothetical protein KP509_35G064200 [Ceratopteris richardii]
MGTSDQLVTPRGVDRAVSEPALKVMADIEKQDTTEFREDGDTVVARLGSIGNSNPPRKRNSKMGALALIARFKSSLSNRRMSKRHRNLSLAIQDIRDWKQQHLVEEFRKLLFTEDLLPPQHDDYHTLLRY